VAWILTTQLLSSWTTDHTSQPPDPIKINTKILMTIFGNERNLDLINFAVDKDLSVLLVGETGTGKTTMIREVAKKKKQKLVRFNLTGETTVDDFVGKYTLKDGETVWQDGVLLQAMKEGKWLVVDEINSALPEILFVLHSLLDDDKYVVVPQHEGEIVKPHKNFRFFATMNPTDEYSGTKELNKAFKSRFDITIQTEYATNEHEAQIIMERTDNAVDEGVCVTMIGVANEIRKMKARHEIFFTLSTRDLIQWARLVPKFGLKESFEFAILNKANGDTEKVRQIAENTFGAFENLEGKEDLYSPKNWLKTVKMFEEANLAREKALDSREEQLQKYEKRILGGFGEKIINALGESFEEKTEEETADEPKK